MDTTNSISNSMEASTIIDRMDTRNSNSSSKPKKSRGFAVGGKPTARKRSFYRAHGFYLFPLGVVAHELIHGKFAEIIDLSAPVYLTAVLQYLTAEVLEVAGEAAMEKNMDIICSHYVHRAFMKDEELRTFITLKTTDDGEVSNLLAKMSL